MVAVMLTTKKQIRPPYLLALKADEPSCSLVDETVMCLTTGGRT